MAPSLGPLEQLAGHLRFFETVAHSVDLLEEDVALQSDGWIVSFAVDFAELHAHSLGNRDDSLVAPFPDEAKIQQDVRGRLALSYLFSAAFESVFILPPHLVELYDYVKLVEAKLIDNTAQLSSAFAAGLARSLRRAPSFPDVLQIAHRVKRGEPLSDADRKLIATFALEHFKEAYLCASLSRQADATRSMVSLLRTKKLLPMQSAAPDLTELSRRSSVRADEITSEIRRRRGRGRQYHSYLDGVACALLEELNLSRASEKIRYLLVTHSTHVIEAVQATSAATSLPVYVRDLNYLLAYFSTLAATPDETLSRVRALKPLMTTVGTLASRIRRCLHSFHADPVSRPLPTELDSLLSDAERILPHLRRLMDCRENRDLIVSEGSSVVLRELVSSPRDNDSVSTQNLETAIAITVIDLVLGHDNRVLEALEDELERLNGEVTEIASALNHVTASIASVLKFDSLSDPEIRMVASSAEVAASGRSQILLGHIPGEPPITLRIDDPALRKFSRAIESARGTNRPSLEAAIRRALMAVASATRSADRPSVHALLAYLHCSVLQWDAALEQLDVGLREASASERHRYNLLLLRSIVLRRLGRSAEGIQACLLALETDPDDAALNRELAVLLWQASRADVGGGEGLRGIKPTLDLGIQYAEKALKCLPASSSKSRAAKEIRAQICNTLAYLHTERNTAPDLRKADEYLKDLAALVPQTRWIGRFFDTHGYLRLIQAGRGGTIDVRRRMLAEAIGDFAAALQDAGLTGIERDEVERHYRQAEMMLEQIAQQRPVN